MTAQLTIANLYPLCMSAQGDEGNAKALRNRAEARGISTSILTTYAGELPRADIYLIAGGCHPEQTRLVELLGGQHGLAAAIADGAVVLGVNVGFQILGEWFDTPDGTRHAGLGILGMRSSYAPLIEGRVGTLPNAALGLPAMHGYECHTAHTELDADVEPLTRLEFGVGNGVPARIAGHHGSGFAAIARGESRGSHPNAGPIGNGPDPSALRRARAANANRRAHASGARMPSHTNRGTGHSQARPYGPPQVSGAARIVPTTTGLGATAPTSAPAGHPGSELTPAADGAVSGHVIGTYLHGPVLQRNPDFADLLIGWAIGRTLDPVEAQVEDAVPAGAVAQPMAAPGAIAGFGN
ncbi:MAG TPA: hypothetical protein VKB59_06250 [Micromonosporaceae bacterium]|nr:hypothetical protein [Micromonosporaceae bacterium]